MVSIVETSEHAAKSYLSTLAVLQLDSILTGAKKVSIKKPKIVKTIRTHNDYGVRIDWYWQNQDDGRGKKANF